MRSLTGLCRSIYFRPWKAAKEIFTVLSVLFMFVKIVTHFLPAVKIEGYAALSVALAISLILGLSKVWKPSQIQIAIANCDTALEVVFGDLFEQDGIRVIPVNEFFDSKLGKAVSDKSVHGAFLQKCFGGYPEPFDKQVDEQLRGKENCEVRKAEGKSKSYPIGSTALLTVNQDRYLAVASAKADPNTCKA